LKGFHVHSQRQLIRYTYTVEDGLNSNFVTDLLNDSRGLLWIGTQNGLNTFNGKQFRSVDFSQVPESFVIKTVEAPDGTIWFSTLDGGLFRVHNYKAIPHPKNDSIIAAIPSNPVPFGFTIDSLENCYLFGDRFFLDLPTAGKIETRAPVSERSFTHSVYHNKLISNGTITNPELEIHFNNSVYSAEAPKPALSSLLTYTANTKTSFAIAITESAIVLMNDTLQKFKLGSKISNSFYFENDTSLWVGTQGNGLFLIQNNQVKMNLLTGYRVHAIIKDFEGGYWAGSEQGLTYFPNLITAEILQDKERQKFLFIDNYNDTLVGLRYDLTMFKANKVKRINTRYSDISSFFFFNSGETGSSTFCYSTNKQKSFISIDWKNFSYQEQASSYNFLKTFERDTFYYTFSCLSYKRNGNSIPILLNGMDILRPNTIKKTQEVNTYWIGHMKGVSKVRIDTIHWRSEVLSHYTFSRNIKQLFNIQGDLFACSTDDYFYKIDTITKKVTPLTHINREDVRCVKELSPSQVLLGTAAGLKLLYLDSSNIGQLKIRDISNEQGLSALQIDDIEVIQDTIYANSEPGVLLFPMEVLEMKQQKNGNIHLLSIAVNGEELASATAISIYNDEVLDFEISSVSFKDRISYLPQYKLSPVSTKWNTHYSDKISFYNLSKGAYELQVKDRYGSMITIPFTVRNYFFQETWFIVFLCLFFTTLVLIPLFIRYRFKVSQSRLEAEKDNWRLRTLTSQLKPHFIFNALSSIQAFILKNDARTSSEYLSKFSMHIRYALEQARSDQLSLKEALSAAKNYLEIEQMRLGGELDYSITIQEGIEVDKIYIPVLLLQPYIENAIIHGITGVDYKGEIRIELKFEGEVLNIKIIDNGKGIQSSSGHRGYGVGTSVNQERIAILNAQSKRKFEISLLPNEDQKGTCVTIKIQHVNESN
jgi:anti-sigma regulatory factor (Ser/Thr protein kinase)